MTSFGQSVKWTDFSGTVTETSIDGCATEVQAKKEALEQAKRFGWTPPIWWQWWRWNDTKESDLNPT